MDEKMELTKKISTYAAGVAMVFIRGAFAFWAYSLIGLDFNLPYLNYWQVLMCVWAIRLVLKD